MGRRNILGRLSQEEATVEEVWEWYRFHHELVDEEEERTLERVDIGLPLENSRYSQRERRDLVAIFRDRRTELRYAAMLHLLAAAEAALRIDFIERIARKKKRDAVSREFTKLYKAHGLRTNLEEQILAVHRENSAPEGRRIIGDFIGALKLRHWLAHGRYWKPKFGQQYDPDRVFEICHGLTEALDLA